MPDPVITNPQFANNPPGVGMYPQSDDYWALDPGITLATLTSNIPTHLATNLTTPALGVGNVVEFQSWNGSTSGGSGSPKYPTCALSATTADGSIVGVITGTGTAGNPVTAVGQVVQVRRFGIAQVIVDNTCTVGHALVNRPAPPGWRTTAVVWVGRKARPSASAWRRSPSPRASASPSCWSSSPEKVGQYAG